MFGKIGSLTGLGSKTSASQGSTSKGGSIFGFGGQRQSVVNGPSINPQRIVRRIDVLGEKNMRRRLDEIHTFGKFDLKHQNGTVERAQLKKKEMSKLIANSEFIGKTEAQIKSRLDKNYGFAATTDKGEKVFYKLYGNPNLTKVRKEIGEAVVKERKNIGVDPEVIKKRIKIGETISRMAGNSNRQNANLNARDRAEVMMKNKGDSSDLGIGQAVYSVGVQTKKLSEADLRKGTTLGGVGYSTGNDSIFVNDQNINTVKLDGSNRQRASNNNLSMFNGFGRKL